MSPPRLRSALAAVLLALTAATNAEAQRRLGVPASSALLHLTGATVASSSVLAGLDWEPTRPVGPPDQEPSRTRLPPVALLASVGSTAGLYGGALAGILLAGDEDSAMLYVGAGVGTVLGAAGGAGLLTKDGAGSLLGSLAGATAGALLTRGWRVQGGVVGHVLVHGLVTALVATR